MEFMKFNCCLFKHSGFCVPCSLLALHRIVKPLHMFFLCHLGTFLLFKSYFTTVYMWCFISFKLTTIGSIQSALKPRKYSQFFFLEIMYLCSGISRLSLSFFFFLSLFLFVAHIFSSEVFILFLLSQ